MAPHMQRVYHSTEEPNRCTLRTTKYGEDYFPRLHNVDISNITRKKDFLLCMGLQMKRSQCEYSTLDGNHAIERVNISDGVKLRDCSVVILGASCKICGKCFKCETDVNLHLIQRHRLYFETNAITANEIQCFNVEDEEHKIFSDPCELPTIAASKSPVIKLQDTTVLVLRIGKEEVCRLPLKRKYLRRINIDIGTQTEQHKELTSEFSNNEFTEKNVDEGVVPHIDFPVFDNSSCKCCTSSMHVVNSTNRYVTGNNAASKETQCEESTAQKRTSILNRLTKSCAITAMEGSAICDVLPHTLPSNSDIMCVYEQCNRAEQKDTKNMYCYKNSKPSTFSTRHTNSSTVFNDTCDSSVVAKSFRNPTFNSNKMDNDIKLLAARCCQRNINGNKKQKNAPPEKQSQLLEISKTVKVIMPPIIFPIIMPKNDISLINLTKYRRAESLQQLNKSVIVDEQNSDDEVQEVLRIVRGRDSNEEINHESPNRVEQEMLVRDAMKDIMRMEEEGCQLVEKEDVNPTKKRKRVVAKSDTKNDIAKDEAASKRHRAAVQPNFENNIVTNTTEERYLPTTMEPFTNMHKSNHNDKLCILDNAKENVIAYNKNINIPTEVLECYGIGHYSETSETKNNRESIQEPVGHFLVPCSYRMKNRSNRPTVIDLVNDTDE
ncbi:uncharacterized protein LOC143342514 [Colletes latitarsis]|uniref:uncharacterized protein LOC143342514 n=1 Tax=Colletes latitarsis TaxID=2605962 RepID=UPI0040366D82